MCRSCNHGWLASFEGAARPLVGSLINDLALRLDPEQQSIVARWAIKMAMVLEATRGALPEFFFYAESEREAFRTAQTIPADTTVWLGRYVGRMFSYAAAMDGSYDGSPGWRRADVFASTFVAGRFAFQVLSLRLRAEHAALDRLELPENPGPSGRTTVQVWPSTTPSLSWPPPVSFTDGDGPGSVFAWEQRWR